MLLLAETYRRLPRSSLIQIKAGEADVASTFEDIDGAFPQVLASHLSYLALVGSDAAFVLPGEIDNRGTNFAVSLADKVRVLPAAEATAPHVLLECARAVPAAVISYDSWW